MMMNKSPAGRKPKNGIKAMSLAEKQSQYRERKKLDVIEAEKNIDDAKTEALLKIILKEFTKIDNDDPANLLMIRNVIVELCNRYQMPIDQIEEAAGGLIDLDEETLEAIQDIKDEKNEILILQRLLEKHHLELDQINKKIQSVKQLKKDDELFDARTEQLILINLLHERLQSIS
jgi:hypothetical protein